MDEGGADGEVGDGERGAHEERHVRLHGEHRVDEEDDDDELPDAVGLHEPVGRCGGGDAVVGGEAGQGEGEGEEEDGVADVVQVDVLHGLQGGGTDEGGIDPINAIKQTLRPSFEMM